jgi:hypothetical protein
MFHAKAQGRKGSGSGRYHVSHEFAAEIVEDFNRQSPVGTPVWYWRDLWNGPVLETQVREAAYISDAGIPVVFLEKVSGYVSVFHVTVPLERQRTYVKFYQVGLTKGEQ